LLPALPTGWRNGSVSGWRVRGGFEVALQWQDGRLQMAEIRHRNAATCKVRYGTRSAEFALKPGEPIRFNGDFAVAD